MTPTNLLHEVLPPGSLNALGWTLLHSVWQGTLLAILLAILLRLMHRHSAATRYRVAWAGLMALVLMAGITYYKLYEPAVPPASLTRASVIVSSTAVTAGAEVLTTQTFWEEVTAQSQAYFEQHLPAMVLLWLLGMVVMGMRLLGGWVYVQRLRSYRVQPVPEAWQQKAAAVGRQLGLAQAVAVAESALVKMPMVIGHVKPLILLPLGALAGLSTAQIEAILAHELAHVHRKDYLLNLLQSLVETLFFFHPAVWWISDCIRTEREHACDDLAISVCGDSLTYAYALTHLEELLMKNPTSSPQLTMAFSGRRRTLLSRITRLVQQPALRPSFSEGFLAACALTAGLLVFSATAWANYQTPDAPQPAHQEPVALPVPAPQQEYLATTAPVNVPEPEEELEEALTMVQLADDLVIVQNKKGKVVEVYVNGKRVPKNELPKYQARIERQLKATKNAKTMSHEETERAMAVANGTLQEVERETRFAPRPPMAPRRPVSVGRGASMAPVSPVPPVPPVAPVAPLSNDKEGQKRYKQDLKEYETQLKEYQAQLDEFHAQREAYGATVQVDRQARLVDQARRQEDHKRRMDEHAVRMKEHEKRMAEHAVRMKEHDERMKKHDAMMKELKAALVSDGLIKSSEADYTFKLDKTGLFVDDKKQSDALYQKYKKIISTATGEDIDMMLKKEGSNFTINTNKSTKTK
ncbi:M48 family metalloprotease [Nibribacter ruber]|uniref:M48 family metalloprotease n=1 Tax=Nibribacter ruber TaxID=2698458 RepID=A0A6P1NYB1_9BACT|nr:M56 family metallopeptidase [Nibribacter ruber]QHL88030.1 M48 family metalloprotease [Nibribacter ruber]